MRRLALPFALATAVMMLAGCGRLEIGVTLHEDGSGVLVLDVGVTRAALQQFTGESESLAPLLRASGLDPDALSPDVTYEATRTDDEVGARLTIPFAAGDDVATEIDRAFGRLAEDAGSLVGAGGLFESFTLVRDDSGWQFAAATAGSEPGRYQRAVPAELDADVPARAAR